MNIYSSDVFLRVAAEAFFFGKNWAIEYVQNKERCYRVLVIDGRQVIGSVPFMDFLEELPAPDEAVTRTAAFLPRVGSAPMTLSAYRSQGLPQGFEVSPTILWEDWQDFADFVRFAQTNNSQAFSKRQKKKRETMTGELPGELRYEYQISKSEAARQLARLIDWKSRQYKRTGLVDAFARPGTRRFFELLLAADVLQLSGVFAGDQPLALHAGFIRDGRFYCVLPAYDIQYQQYKPGQMLLELMLESSFRAGHKEFDFLLGDEAYKFYYANRIRIVGPVGYRLLQDRIYAPLRRAAMRVVRRQPGIYRGLQKLKRTLKERGLL